MNDRLEYKLKRLCREDVVDWAGERTVQRAEGYLDRVGEIFASGDFIAAKVRGTEEYTTNVFIDKYGEWNSVCTCPVRMNCKHCVALALCAARKLNDGTTLPESEESASLRLDRDAIVAEYKSVHEPPPPPPPPAPKVMHFKVEENPFGRFTAKGGRRAQRYSFRVVTPSGTYHWSFIVSTLIYSLAKGGLECSGCDRFWWKEDIGTDFAMFTCSCGEPQCAGFEGQECICTEESVLWRVHYCGTIVELEFDRIHYEYWALQMLWRMRGSVKLRRDPWDSVAVDSGFTYAVASLLDARPRLRALWNLIREKRHVDEADLELISSMAPDANSVPADRCELRHFFPREFSTAGKIDLRQEEATCEEEWRVKERLSDVKITRGRFFVYSNVIGRHWETTELAFGQKIVFCRESGDDYHRHSLRVDDAADGRTIGYLRRKEAYWLTEMMDRHGLVLEGQVERIGRDGKMIPVRIDLCFTDPNEEAMEWGASLKDGDRLYFEMLRAVVLRPEICSASTIQSEADRIKKLFDAQTGCSEIAFLLALLSAGAKEVAYRLTEEEIAKRREYCNKVRKAMECEPVGGLIGVDGLKVLPLRATFADPTLDCTAARERMYRWIRLSWLSNGKEERPKVRVPDFPSDATGFAVFRGRDLLDVCLCGIQITDPGLFDSLAFYDGKGNSADNLSDGEAFGEVKRFLGDLPVRERDKEGYSPRFWLERGIHDGEYDINDEGRLIALRILMLKARRQWVD